LEADSHPWVSSDVLGDLAGCQLCPPITDIQAAARNRRSVPQAALTTQQIVSLYSFGYSLRTAFGLDASRFNLVNI
jgi:hypothetical protein